MGLKKKNGFTLLEIIIVIIIIGVLASLALPRLFNTVARSRAAEALSAIATTRYSMERCRLEKTTFVGCTFGVIDVENPSTAPNAHFDYSLTGLGVDGFTITATRNSVDADAGETQTITVIQTSTTVTRSGSTIYQGI